MTKPFACCHYMDNFIPVESTFESEKRSCLIPWRNSIVIFYCFPCSSPLPFRFIRLFVQTSKPRRQLKTALIFSLDRWKNRFAEPPGLRSPRTEANFVSRIAETSGQYLPSGASRVGLLSTSPSTRSHDGLRMENGSHSPAFAPEAQTFSSSLQMAAKPDRSPIIPPPIGRRTGLRTAQNSCSTLKGTQETSASIPSI